MSEAKLFYGIILFTGINIINLGYINYLNEKNNNSFIDVLNKLFYEIKDTKFMVNLDNKLNDIEIKLCNKINNNDNKLNNLDNKLLDFKIKLDIILKNINDIKENNLNKYPIHISTSTSDLNKYDVKNINEYKYNDHKNVTNTIPHELNDCVIYSENDIDYIDDAYENIPCVNFKKNHTVYDIFFK